MKVRICPLCDSEMKKAHYCDTCKSFIWQPEMLDVHYNAESRGRGEIDCAYGEDHDRYDHESYQPTAQKALHKRRDTAGKGRTRKISDSHQEVFGSSTRKNSETGKPKKKRGIISKIIAIIIGFNVIGSLLGVVAEEIGTYGFENMVESVFERIGLENDRTPEPGLPGDDSGAVPIETEVPIETDEGDEDYEDYYDSSYKEITDAELVDYPDGCNGFSHFEVTGSEFLPFVEEWLTMHYGENSILDSYEDISNYRYVYDDDLEYVYLATSQVYDVPNDNYGYIEINYDSVTDQVHSVTASSLSLEETELFFKEAAALLTEDITDDEIADSMEGLFESEVEDYNSVTLGSLYVFVMANGDGTLWLDISPAQ